MPKPRRRGRTRAEVDEIILWLTGYSQTEFAALLAVKADFETFFAEAPSLNPKHALTRGVICGVRIEDIEETTMREIRYLAELIDELGKGRPMQQILRQ